MVLYLLVAFSAATIILRKRRRIEVPHARMRSEWHQLRRQLMQQQQHGKSNEIIALFHTV